MSEALIVIGFQNDYFPGGKMEVSAAEEAVQHAKSLIQAFRQSNKHVIFIQHVCLGSEAAPFAANTPGFKIHQTVQPLSDEKIIPKCFPNSFRKTEFESYLHKYGIKKLIFCGMMTHLCIDSTVRFAFDRGFSCIVASDACATRGLSHADGFVSSEDVNMAFLTALSAVFASVAPTKTIIQELC